MKVGFIFECGPQGADKQICEYIAAQLIPNIKMKSRTLDNKHNLLEDAAKVAATLLADACDKVLIVWDLRPSWPNKNNKPCRKHERDALLQSLANAKLTNKPIYLVCVEQELESWLLADETKINTFLSTPAHPYSEAKRVAKPDRVPNPKSKIINHFRAARGLRYEDRIHAIKVLSCETFDIKKMRRSETFKRFESKLVSD